MDGDSWILIILLALLIIGAAYCAASEIAFASMNIIRIKSYADNGDKRAVNALYVSDNFERALAIILIGNNITHIAFASLATLMSTQLWGLASVKYTAIASTIIVFLFSEMIPKSYAKANSESFALTASGSLIWLMKILTPVASCFLSISRGLSKLFPEKTEPLITEEELYDIIETAVQEGVLKGGKRKLVNSALDFDVITAGDIYTARESIVALDINADHAQILQCIKRHKYSRLPVYSGNIDNIIGILPIRSFLKHYIKNGSFDIRNLLLEPYFVSTNMPVDNLLKDMSSKKLHMSVVVDEHGKTLGIVTVEDILEELVGEIWDEDDIANDWFE